MGRFLINGGKKLFGEITVDGSKNAALPIIFACITINGVSVISNIPDIADVDVAFEILRRFGARIERSSDTVKIDTRNLEFSVPDEALVSKIRASSYLIGACLSRFGRACIQRFGGCNFDARPIDMHISAAVALGASLDGDKILSNGLSGCDIYFSKISVGATVNAILLASAAKGKSRIYGYAREPHVISLIEFLKSGGADITLLPDCIEIRGAAVMGAEARIIPDMIEAGTYLALSLITESEIKISGAYPEHLSSFTEFLSKSGASVDVENGFLIARGSFTSYAKLKTDPYPAFPTDLQPQTAPLLADFHGGMITEGVWHNRFGYLGELSRFGIDYELGDGFAEIKKSDIHCANATSPDLRGGAALLLCALRAEGESVIADSDIIKRGYSNIVDKLRKIGAEIKEI